MSLLYLDSWGWTNDGVNDPLERHYGNTGNGRAVIAGARYAGSPNAGYAVGTTGVYYCYYLPPTVTFPIWWGYAIRPKLGFQGRDAAGIGLGAVTGWSPDAAYTGSTSSLAAVLTCHRGIAIGSVGNLGSMDTLLIVTDPVMGSGDEWVWVEGCIEMQKVDESDTTTIIRINGSEVARATGPERQPSDDPNNSYNYFVFGSVTGSAELGSSLLPPIADFYLCDSAGLAPYNTWLNEIQIECKLPTGDSPTWTEWTPLGGGNHYGKVDEVPPNDDTDYVSAPVNKKDAYTFPALTNAVGNVLAVQTNSIGRLLDNYAAYYQDIIVRRAGTDALVSTAVQKQNRLTTRNPMHSITIMTQDPTDSSDWDIAKVNAAEFGPRRA